MGQRWKRLSLMVVLLLWKNADGFKGVAYSSEPWDQPPDTLPLAVQSSMSETHVTGTLPVEEVGSTLFLNKPLKSRSKLNLLQSVKGGSSSYLSMSHAQTAPSSYASASLPLPPVQKPSSSLMSSESTVPGVASGLSLETQYATGGSGSLISMQGGSSSYAAELGTSGQSTSDGLHVSSSQGTSVHQSAEARLPVFSQSISYSSSSAPVSPQISSDSKSTGAAAASPYTWGTIPYSSLSSQAQGSTTSQGSSGAKLSASSVQSIPTQVGSDSYSGVSKSLTASSLYTPGYLSNKLDALPLQVSSQSTNAQSSPIVSMSNTQSRSGTQLATSSRYAPVQGGSSTLSLKPLGTLGRYTPMSPTKYIKGPTSSRTTYGAVSQVGSLSQMEASGPLLSQGGNYYSGLLPQSQAASGQYALGYSKPISSPQGTSSQSASVLSSHKQPVSASQGSFGAQFGALQGMSSSSSGSIQSQGTLGLYCKCALPPLDVGSQTTPISHKRLASSYGTQSEFIPFTLQGSVTYDGSPQPKVAASQFALVSQSYPSVSSQGVASQSTTVRDSQKQLTSTYTGSSGTQAGSSTPVTLHHAAYGGSSQPQHTASQFSPGLSSSYQSLSLSSPLGVASRSSSWKQFTSASHGSSGTQAGSSFTLQGSTAYGGSSPQDVSQSVPGSSSPYASVSLPSPQGVASQSNQAYQGYSVSQSQKSQRWQPLAAHWTQGIQTSDAAASQGSSSSSSPMHVSSLSSARGSSRVSSPLVSALVGSTSYDGSFRSQSLSTKYTPGSQLLSYDPSVAGQGTSSASASEISSSYSSMNNQNVPVPSRSSSSRRFYSIKG